MINLIDSLAPSDQISFCMNFSKIRLKGWALVSVVVLMMVLSSAQTLAVEKASPYVIFSIHMGPEALGTDGGEVQPESVWIARETSALEDIKREFGEQRAGQDRYVGFSVVLTPTLNVTPTQLQAEVVRALDLAEHNKIPIFFHLDDQHAWWRSPELSHNPQMVEWSDFPKAGQASGPVVPRYWLNWGDPVAVYPASPPCFGCPAFRAALSKRLRECVAQPIVQRLKSWRTRGQYYLFAGIASGNETSVPDFSRAFAGYAGKLEDAVGVDRTRIPPVTIHMSKEDMVPVGYHSLSAMGYDWQSIKHLAQAQGTSASIVVEQLLYKVAHDYAEFQAKTLCEAGIPKDRIYTHFTSSNYSLSGYAGTIKKQRNEWALDRPGSKNISPPFASAVNPYSRPGFTIVHDAVNLNELVRQLNDAHASDGGRAWAVVESYCNAGQPGKPLSEVDYREYLGGLLAHGAKVVNCYGWNIDSGPYAVRGSGVIPAVKNWLAGQPLPTTWVQSSATAKVEAIHAKISKMEQTAQGLVASGHDPHVVQAMIESFQKEFEPLLKAGQWEQAEAAVDRAIEKLQAQRR